MGRRVGRPTERTVYRFLTTWPLKRSESPAWRRARRWLEERGFIDRGGLTERGRRLLELFETDVGGLRPADLLASLDRLGGLLCLLRRLAEGPQMITKAYYACGYSWRYAGLFRSLGLVEEFKAPGRRGYVAMVRMTERARRLLAVLEELHGLLEPEKEGGSGGS